MTQTYEGLQLRVSELSKIRNALHQFEDHTADTDIRDLMRETETLVNTKIQNAESDMERFF